MIDPKLKNWIIIVVTAVWALNFVVGLIPQIEFQPDPTINAIFMGIVGGLFALSARKQPPADDKKVEDSKPPDKEVEK